MTNQKDWVVGLCVSLLDHLQQRRRVGSLQYHPRLDTRLLVVFESHFLVLRTLPSSSFTPSTITNETMKSALALILVTLLASVSAFSPASRPILTPGRLIQGGQNLHTFVLKAEEKAAAEEAAPKPTVSSDGTYYDDEVCTYANGSYTTTTTTTTTRPRTLGHIISLLFRRHSPFLSFSPFQVEPAPKAGISDSMKERLLREASSGLDSEQKQNNVILYIILGVAVLVVLGGQGVLY